jgi:adenylosuccinate lyase
MNANDVKLYRLRAVSVADGRYADKTECISKYFSEETYILDRLEISVRWFKYIVTNLIPNHGVDFNRLLDDFQKMLQTDKNYISLRIKMIEKMTKHDVQAIIDFLKEFYINGSYGDIQLVGYIHFCLTSQDLNTSGIKLPLRDLIRNELNNNVKAIETSIKCLVNRAEGVDTSVMGITHGQPAVITTMNNTLTIMHNQINEQFETIIWNCDILQTKFGGATGGLNALKMVFEVTGQQFNIKTFVDEFCSNCLGMERNEYSGQTDSYIDIVNLINSINVLNAILKKICTDVWLYISKEYFILKHNDNETGSSAMPHKVNPIDFENAEANLKLAIDLGRSISDIILDLRMQRDLRDSTALRNLGSYFGYCILAYGNITNGFDKLLINTAHTAKEIKEHPEIYSESLQICLRTFGTEDSYKMLKELTRGEKITVVNLLKFVEEVPLNEPFIAMYFPDVTVKAIREKMRLLVTDHAAYYGPVKY